jgi:hypothetical protein
MGDVNYPDVLGAITGGQRMSVDVLQLAAASRPRLPRAGQILELVLLVQNASDAPVELAVELALPEVDARKQRLRFVCDPPRVRVPIQPAEAGVIVFPVRVHSDTAPSDDYRARFTLDLKITGKPARLRHAHGGGAFDPQDLPASAGPWFGALKSLRYDAAKLHGRALDVSFSLGPAQSATASLEARKVQYLSLWRAATAAQASTLLHLYTPLLRGQILPQLKRAQTLPPLIRATMTHFEKAGYPLDEAEATLVAKMMSLILEYASPDDTHHGYIAAGRWAITPLLGRALDLEHPPEAPRWLRALLRLVEQEPRAAQHVASAMAGPALFDLLYDAAQLGFDVVQSATGEDVGSAEERDSFASGLIDLLRAGGPIDFSRAYLPLITGGLLINEYLLMPQERPADLLHGLAAALERREAALDPGDLPVYEITTLLLDRTAQKYGFRVLP